MQKIQNYLLAAVMLLLAVPSFAQDKPSSPKSEVSGKVGGSTVKIVYHQPSARGRKIMGGLVPYGEVWRTGANNATTIEFDKDVKIEGKDLKAGKYALFTIPNENEWTIVFNTNHKQWGAYDYKQSEDVLRVNVKPAKTSEFVETFVINTDKDNVVMKWENTQVAFKVK